MPRRKNKLYIKVKRAGREWEKTKLLIKFYLIVGLIILVIVLLIFHVIEIGIFFEANWKQNIMFTLFNALGFNVFLSALGMFNSGIKEKKYRLMLLFILGLFFICGFGFLNFCITLNVYFLKAGARTYCTGGFETGDLLYYNLLFFVGVIVLALPLRKKKGVD